ncbi:MAG TPA: hypothetical protein VN047_16520 [Sphingopyxis sp.]|uniref:hypothetical protein n=1 Tax=Sphingopyxis sp. TaxID=1908224 RepID=UPI002BD6B1E4|nr:hypothetical protein [Sphingopyxis sp.]HWW58500.1 hypothetical protein [Sphingopyxis sp.]
MNIAFARDLERLRHAIIGSQNHVERWLAPISIPIEAIEQLAENRCAAPAATQDHDRWSARHASTLSPVSAIGNSRAERRVRIFDLTQAIVFGHNIPTFLDWTDMFLPRIPTLVD